MPRLKSSRIELTAIYVAGRNEKVTGSLAVGLAGLEGFELIQNPGYLEIKPQIAGENGTFQVTRPPKTDSIFILGSGKGDQTPSGSSK